MIPRPTSSTLFPYTTLFRSGLSAIPLMHREVVTTYKWSDVEEFSDILLLSNPVAGPINRKLSGYSGWRLSGLKGLLTALAATVIPTVVLMILLLSVLNAYKDKSWVQGMSKRVIPIAGVMIGVLAWDFIVKSKTTMGWLATMIIIGISVVVMQVLGIHPAFMIGALIAAALLSKGKTERKRVSSE